MTTAPRTSSCGCDRSRAEYASRTHSRGPERFWPATAGPRTAPTTLEVSPERSWSWGESTPRPLSGNRPRYDHSRDCGSRLPHCRVSWACAHRRIFLRCHRSFPTPAVFPAVIHCFCCRAAVDRPRVPLRVAMTLNYLFDQAARAKSLLALLFGAPFKESEQLRSHERLPVSTSKPISPLFGDETVYRAGASGPF